MSNNKQSSSIEWLMEQITYDNGFGKRRNSYSDSVDLSAYFEKAKAMHKEEIDNLPIHIHEGIENIWVYIEDGIVHVEPNTKINEKQ